MQPTNTFVRYMCDTVNDMNVLYTGLHELEIEQAGFDIHPPLGTHEPAMNAALDAFYNAIKHLDSLIDLVNLQTPLNDTDDQKRDTITAIQGYRKAALKRKERLIYTQYLDGALYHLKRTGVTCLVKDEDNEPAEVDDIEMTLPKKDKPK